MKTSNNLTMISCILLTISINIILSSAQVFPSSPVLDTTGQELRRENSYYILPANTSNGGGGGGLTLQLSQNSNCPYEIIQSPSPKSNGFPLQFTPVSSDDVVRVNIDSNIAFVNVTVSKPCSQSNVWRANTNSSDEPILITTGGVAGVTGPQSFSNWFKIQNLNDAYQIQYCPGSELCGTSPCGLLRLCENVGIYIQNGSKRLALNQPNDFKVVFQRA